MKIKHIVLTILIGILLSSGVPSYARLFSNNGEVILTSVSTMSTGGAALTPDKMAELIIKGAQFYFLANADIDYLSEKIEISDISGADTVTMCNIANHAIENMKKANYYYGLLLDKMNKISYNETVLARIMTFDYDSFQEQNNLLKDVFSEVKSYLVKGDVRGIYSRITIYFDSIIESLETIKGELESGKLPDNNLVWNLNQLNVKTHMFGQYAARVFETVR